MTIHKKIEFSGVFEKAYEDDDTPIRIDNTIIYLNTDGSVFFEVSVAIEQQISLKQLQEKAYHGDYQVIGFCPQGSHIKANTDKNVPLKIGYFSNMQSTSKIKLRNLNFSSKDKVLSNDDFKQISYGLSNIEIFSEFIFFLDAINVKVLIKPITLEKKPQAHELSAEIQLIQTVTKQPEIDKDDVSLETYCAWIISLLSFISGKKVNELYRKKTSYINSRKNTEEIWFGHLTNIPQGTIQVIESPLFSSFFKQCCQQINEEVFVNKGLGLALLWYIDTFYRSASEVNFLLFCTVFESLNKKYLNSKENNATPQKILPSSLYDRIRKKLLKTVSDFELEIEDENLKQKYSIFKNKFKKKFDQGDLNQITNLNASAGEMLDTYQITYQDLYPRLEFIQARNNIVHQGWSDKNMVLEYLKLSNLVIRTFLGILKYEGNYIERDVEDSFYGLKHRKYPIER